MRRVKERPRTSRPSAFQEKGCWNIRWPRSPAKKRPSDLLPANILRNRASATLRSWASSTTAKSKGSFAVAAKCSVTLPNTPAPVIRFRSASPASTRSKMDQRISRCLPPMRVLRPSRETSRYASQVFSCHASTTSAHSPSRKCVENLCPWVFATAC